MKPLDPNFGRFLSLWWEKFQTTPVRCSELVPLAEAAGLKLGNATTVAGKRAVLGQMVGEARKEEVSGFTISALPYQVIGQTYRLEISQGVSLEPRVAALDEFPPRAGK